MGCAASVQPQGAIVAGKSEKTYSKLIINQKSPTLRLDFFQETRAIPIEGDKITYKIRYCYVSQRGYYPNALGKANQDSYIVGESLCGDKNTHLFGVFDGHGEYGDLCAHFAISQTAVFLEKTINDNGGVSCLEGSVMEDTVTSTYVHVNKDLHKSAVDDTMSGTTAVAAIVRKDHIIISNIGDSRAIIASRNEDDQLVQVPLSSDQTPFRPDERERVKTKGALVMTLEQIEGNEEIHENWGCEEGDIDSSGDPPRIWDQSLERPGCAFTRSIGDSVAEQVGVFAEPEILNWSLSPRDKFMVIASDGVFEFLTSQAVVDMVAKYSNPLDAARFIVEESYRLWLTYDERTDDITIIIVNFEDVQYKEGQTPDKMEEPKKQIPEAAVSRPVRTDMTKAKRKVIAENWNKGDEEPFDFAAASTEKTPEQLKRIEDMLKANFMFMKLSHAQRSKIFKVMELKEVKNGEVIIREGDAGQHMYIVDSGVFTVHKKDENGVSQQVFQYSNPGAAFGELSLMYGKPRAASVKAASDGFLWCIGRQAFRAVLMKRGSSGLLKIIKALPGFKDSSYTQLQRLCELCSEERFGEGDLIYRTNADTASLAARKSMRSGDNTSDKTSDRTKPHNTSKSGSVSWKLCIVLQGGLQVMSGSDVLETRMFRKPGIKDPNQRYSYLSLDEVVHLDAQVTAAGVTKLATISVTALSEVYDAKEIASILDQLVHAEEVKGMRRESMSVRFQKASQTHLKKCTPRDQLELVNVVAGLGDFGFFGNFTDRTKDDQGTQKTFKIVSKRRVVDSKIDASFLLELQVFSVIAVEQNGCLPLVEAIGQTAGALILEFEDTLVCDLAFAIANGAIADDTTCKFFAVCMYSAIDALHLNGLMHRFINSGSFYIASDGVLKLGDLRYAKTMDGTMAYTICGDPVYFSPEIVGQRGYDYATDLWAFGILLFELIEGVPVFDPAAEETQLFKSIAAFTNANDDMLNFSRAGPDARELVRSLLNPNPKERIGYRSSLQVRSCKYFSTDVHFWDSTPLEKMAKKDIVSRSMELGSSVDISTITLDTDFEEFISPLFSEFD